MSEQVTVTELPSCNFCNKDAEYDFRTQSGSWAYGCSPHYVEWRMYRDLGTGKGQRLVVGETRQQKDHEDTVVNGLHYNDAMAALADLGIEGDEAERELEDWGF